MDHQKLFSKVDGLEPGEQVTAGCRGMRPGQIKKQALGAGVGGALGVAIAVSGGSKTGDLPDFDLTRMCLGLTASRVVIAKQNAWSGKAKTVVGGIPIDQIASLHADEGKVMASKILSLTLELKNGSSIAVEVPRVDLKPGQHFAEALTQRLSR